MCSAGTLTRFGLYNINSDEWGACGPGLSSALYAPSLPKACGPTETVLRPIAKQGVLFFFSFGGLLSQLNGANDVSHYNLLLGPAHVVMIELLFLEGWCTNF